MLVLSKLTNINHANGGSYDPPLFLYSALFAARGRFGWSPRPAAALWRGFPARRRALAGLPRTAGFCGASPHGGGLWWASPRGGGLWRGFPARRRALAGLPRTAAGFGGLPRPAAGFGGASPHSGGFGGFPRAAAVFGGASPHGGELWRGFPARLSLLPRYIRLGAGSFFAVFRIRARHTAKASAKISPVTLPYFILRRKIQEVC